MLPAVISFAEKLALFSDQWAPKTVAQMNGLGFRLVRIEGDFVWHEHADTDEVFIVLEGELRIEFRDGAVTVRQGEMTVVPKGVEHKPFAESECQMLLIDPLELPNTGDEATAAPVEWI